MTSLPAVSYTHLDVYKRQPQVYVTMRLSSELSCEVAVHGPPSKTRLLYGRVIGIMTEWS